MAKLTKAQAKAHDEAVARIAKDVLTDEDKEFVQHNWQESANHVNSTAGAFFTPPDLAHDAVLEMGRTGRIIDLCAGIGTLSLALWQKQAWERNNGVPPLELVCVELNSEYAAIGKKMLPEATWIVGSIFNLPADIGRFDGAMSNPPFGNIQHDGNGTGYKGAKFEFHTIAVASSLAAYGMFIIPQNSSGFRYSGADHYERTGARAYLDFEKQTAIRLEAGCGVDTSVYESQWHGVAPRVEIATAEFHLPAKYVAETAATPHDGALFAWDEAHV